MKTATLRLPEGLYDDLCEEAEARERSFSEYARMLLRNRSEYAGEHATEHDRTRPTTQANTGEYASADRVAELEERIEAIEAELNQQNGGDGGGVLVNGEGATAVSPPEPPTSDVGDRVVAFVREHGPVSASDIKTAFDEEWGDRDIQPDSWWRRHARPALKDSGATYERNRGWSFVKSE